MLTHGVPYAMELVKSPAGSMEGSQLSVTCVCVCACMCVRVRVRVRVCVCVCVERATYSSEERAKQFKLNWTKIFSVNNKVCGLKFNKF